MADRRDDWNRDDDPYRRRSRSEGRQLERPDYLGSEYDPDLRGDRAIAGDYAVGSAANQGGSFSFPPTAYDSLPSPRVDYQDRGRLEGPHAGKGPKGYVRSEARIREDICERLTDDDRLDATSIEIEVKDRVVTLQGSVPNRRMKRLAEELARGVAGASEVRNELSTQDRENFGNRFPPFPEPRQR